MQRRNVQAVRFNPQEFGLFLLFSSKVYFYLEQPVCHLCVLKAEFFTSPRWCPILFYFISYLPPIQLCPFKRKKKVLLLLIRSDLSTAEGLAQISVIYSSFTLSRPKGKYKELLSSETTSFYYINPTQSSVTSLRVKINFFGRQKTSQLVRSRVLLLSQDIYPVVMYKLEQMQQYLQGQEFSQQNFLNQQNRHFGGGLDLSTPLLPR